MTGSIDPVPAGGVRRTADEHAEAIDAVAGGWLGRKTPQRMIDDARGENKTILAAGSLRAEEPPAAGSL